MSRHPDLFEIVERRDLTEVRRHLDVCAPCRAQARLLSGLEAVRADRLPGIGDARQLLSQTRAWVRLAGVEGST